ncbi:hypothetical protein M758_11G018100 [Ceratodon purpureus]|nr:hypothetical protein M758_11G018100 [Ceratodon purpureus]
MCRRTCLDVIQVILFELQVLAESIGLGSDFVDSKLAHIGHCYLIWL